MKTLLCLLILTAHAFAGTIDGQIFITTKGAETFKLALVPVRLYKTGTLIDFIALKKARSNSILPALKTMREQADAAYDKINVGGGRWEDAFEAKWNALAFELYPISGFYYFESLPEPLAVTKTDADGKFRFEADTADCVAVASAQRQTGKYTEYYFWMAKVGDGKTPLFLANDNMISSSSQDSILTNASRSDIIPERMKGKSIDFLEGVAKKEMARIEALNAQAEAQRVAKQKAAEEKVKAENEKLMAAYAADPKKALARAAELYPALRDATSSLNREFAARYKRYQAERKEFFASPDWPIRLAEECVPSLPVK